MAGVDQLKKNVDQYYDEMKYDQIAEQLEPYKGGDDVGLLWRLARANYERQKTLGSDAAQLRLLQDTLATVQRALALDATDPNCHKWMAIYLNAITKLQGSKAQIDAATTIREHMLKACEYGPDDATNWHLIAMWEYSVADISWVMRKLATVVYGEPPRATFQQALDNFLKADQLSDGFRQLSAGRGLAWPIKSRNLMMIGKCYQKLKDKENAIKYLKMVRALEAKTADDEESKEEAISMLKQMGITD
ncbi:regulator of microtubule dynamics protein 1-like [Pollicipes pollicipes]|uniref:regulator of microtubule dynamics protein 1-like n=1 Tax=Pollicipes pollicipes TaxID=41117 RepID=UPI0018859BA8|nr:regulator of microtubule dynamics protein 1-like [Pollicipes pollicipes]